MPSNSLLWKSNIALYTWLLHMLCDTIHSSCGSRSRTIVDFANCYKISKWISWNSTRTWMIWRFLEPHIGLLHKNWSMYILTFSCNIGFRIYVWSQRCYVRHQHFSTIRNYVILSPWLLILCAENWYLKAGGISTCERSVAFIIWLCL